MVCDTFSRQTISDAALSAKHFERLGLDGSEDEDKEMLDYHARLLTAHLSTTWDLRHFFMAHPWRAACGLLESNLATILGEMKLEWQFVVECLDKLMDDRIVRMFQHTLYQPYRDLMTKAEHL
jgi:hypothetical protein